MTAKTPLIFLLAIATVIVSALGSWCWCGDKDVCHDGENQKRFSNSKLADLNSFEIPSTSEISSKDDCCTNCFAGSADASLTNLDNLSARSVFSLVVSVFSFAPVSSAVEQGRPHFVASRFASSGTGWDICLNKRSFLI